MDAAIPANDEWMDISSDESDTISASSSVAEDEHVDSDALQILGTAHVDNNATWIDPDWLRLRTCNINGIELTAGLVISIPEDYHPDLAEDFDAGNHFFYIRELIEKPEGNLVLRGWHLWRLRACNGMDHQKNELALVVRIEDNRADINPFHYYHALDLPPIFAVRQVVWTNAPFPDHSFRQQSTSFTSNEDIEDHAILVCRWIHITQCDVAQRVAPIKGHVLRTITEEECRQLGGKAVRQRLVRMNYRGPDEEGARRTYADVCCGAGGSVSGAVRAGFDVIWCVDQDGKSLASLRLNVGRRTRLLNMTVQEFVTDAQDEAWHIVSVLHVSFPCCFYSQRHTVPGRNDGENSAVIFSMGELLDKVRPRILTFENVEGMFRKDGRKWFYQLLAIITSRGYSVRASVDNLAHHGNPQPRKRLIMIASCPGETLPGPVPKTHGIGTARPELVTVADALATLRGYNIAEHMQAHQEMIDEPYNAHRPLRNCLMTTGYPPHPSGRRSFTLQELSALQTFEPSWRFTGRKTDIRRQIGNAVPSVSALGIFEHVDKHITASDAKPDHPVEVVDLE